MNCQYCQQTTGGHAATCPLNPWRETVTTPAYTTERRCICGRELTLCPQCVEDLYLHRTAAPSPQPAGAGPWTVFRKDEECPAHPGPPSPSGHQWTAFDHEGRTICARCLIPREYEVVPPAPAQPEMDAPDPTGRCYSCGEPCDDCTRDRERAAFEARLHREQEGT